MKAKQPQDAIMDFVSVEIQLPEKHAEVLVRGWGERRRHYVYAFATYEIKTACKRWVARDQTTLHFEPIEWAALPQPLSN
jgi:hypothetical protein